MVPSTSQHVKIVNSIASVVHSSDTKPTASLGTGKMVPGEDQRKVDDKGKLSPRLIMQARATLSTGFMGVLPPLSPCRERAVLASILAMGGIGGHMRLEPPTKFTGKGFPIVQHWLEETANWLELSQCTPN